MQKDSSFLTQVLTPDDDHIGWNMGKFCKAIKF
jgi:hypothetical protein